MRRSSWGKRTDFIRGETVGKTVDITVSREKMDDAPFGIQQELNTIFTALDGFIEQGLVNGYVAYEDFHTGEYVITAYVREGVDAGSLRRLPIQGKQIGPVGDPPSGSDSDSGGGTWC